MNRFDNHRVVNFIHVVLILEQPRHLPERLSSEHYPANRNAGQRDRDRNQSEPPFLRNVTMRSGGFARFCAGWTKSRLAINLLWRRRFPMNVGSAFFSGSFGASADYWFQRFLEIIF